MNEEKALEEMSRLAGTQTEKNLRAAFAGEAQAHVKYNLFAGEARKDPSMSRQIADLFEETANQERAHAKIWFWLVGDLKKDTAEHLKWQPKGKMMNGLQCIRSLLKLQKKRVFRRLLSSWPKSAKLKSSMKEDIKFFLPMWKTANYSRETKRNSGCARTAASLANP